MTKFTFHRPKITRLTRAHMIGWAAFIAYEIFTVRQLTGKLDPPLYYLTFYSLNIGLFYAHLHGLSLAFGQRRGRLALAAGYWLAIIAMYVLLKTAANYLLATPTASYWKSFRNLPGQFFVLMYRGTYFIILSTVYWAAGQIAEYRRLRAETEIQLGRVRNAYLQQQLNPHLLFNALSFIYGTVHRHSAGGARAVELLSDILRFSLEAAGPDEKCLLSAELEQVRNLVELNRLRYDQPLRIGLQVEGEPGDSRIIPLVLLTLTENVFKHGRLRDPADPAELRISLSETGELVYYSRNLKKTKSAYAPAGGIGLAHIRTRLDYVYPGLYQLDIAETPAHYQLTLKLTL